MCCFDLSCKIIQFSGMSQNSPACVCCCFRRQGLEASCPSEGSCYSICSCFITAFCWSLWSYWPSSLEFSHWWNEILILLIDPNSVAALLPWGAFFWVLPAFPIVVLCPVLLGCSSSECIHSHIVSVACPIIRVPDSVGLDGAQEFAFITSPQAVLMLVQGPQFENHGPTVTVSFWFYFFLSFFQ